MQVPESRSTMREKVRSLAKFQMHKLAGRRTEHVHHATSAAHDASVFPPRAEPLRDDPLQESESHIPPGLPGYRVAPGHSGWDPIESVLEMTYLMGKCVRNLLTGRLTTHHPFGLLLMALAGLALLLPFANLVWRMMMLQASDPELYRGILFVPLAILGLMFWVNLLGSLASPRRT